jgi:hypothetical protein
MITEQEQKILDNAPKWATHFLNHASLGFVYAEKRGIVYANPDNCCEYFLGSLLWESVHDLADLRKKQGKTFADNLLSVKVELEPSTIEPHTFADLLDEHSVKPRMKVDYVKLTGDFWEVAKEYQEGKLFYKCTETCIIDTLEQLVNLYKSDNIYRKVETEVTWQDELNSFLGRNSVLYDIEFQSKHVHIDTEIENDQFIEMCHLVSSMNKQPKLKEGK